MELHLHMFHKGNLHICLRKTPRNVSEKPFFLPSLVCSIIISRLFLEEPQILLTNTNAAWRLSNHRSGGHRRNQFDWLLVVLDRACDSTEMLHKQLVEEICLASASLVFDLEKRLQILEASDMFHLCEPATVHSFFGAENKLCSVSTCSRGAS